MKCLFASARSSAGLLKSLPCENVCQSRGSNCANISLKGLHTYIEYAKIWRNKLAPSFYIFQTFLISIKSFFFRITFCRRRNFFCILSSFHLECFLPFQAVFFTIYPVRYAGITLRENIMAYSPATDVPDFSNDRLEGTVNMCARPSPKGVVWWTRRIGISVVPADWQNAFRPA